MKTTIIFFFIFFVSFSSSWAGGGFLKKLNPCGREGLAQKTIDGARGKGHDRYGFGTMGRHGALQKRIYDETPLRKARLETEREEEAKIQRYKKEKDDEIAKEKLKLEIAKIINAVNSAKETASILALKFDIHWLGLMILNMLNERVEQEFDGDDQEDLKKHLSTVLEKFNNSGSEMQKKVEEETGELEKERNEITFKIFLEAKDKIHEAYYEEIRDAVWGHSNTSIETEAITNIIEQVTKSKRAKALEGEHPLVFGILPTNLLSVYTNK